MGRKLLKITVFLVVALNIISTIFIIQTTDHLLHPTAQATAAQVQICINAPPTIVVPCNTTISQGETFTCQLAFTDINPDLGSYFLASWPGTPLFSVPTNGTIFFEATNDDVGNYSVLLSVDDNAGCSNSRVNTTFNFSIENINDPPYLLQNLPDIEFVVNTTTLAYFLSDYFRDPDGDVLTYTSTIVDSPFTLNLVGGIGVQVSANSCNGEDDAEAYVQFTATDPFNESATSNLVKLKVTCPEEAVNTGTSGGGGGGGGSGGGGASSLCTPEWECLDWMSCLPTGFEWRQCYDLNGCEDPEFLKRECTYVGEQPTCEENWLCSDWSACAANRTQTRSCSDLNDCGTAFYQPFLEQQCIYLATCSDGIKNGDETDVDCGGSCPACSVIETPSFISPAAFNMWLLFAILLSVVLIGGVYRFYREEIIRGVSKLLLLIARRHEKEIFLFQEERNLFLERILAAEKNSVRDDLPDSEKYARLTNLARELFQVLAKLPEHFTREEFTQGLAQRRMSHELQHLLTGFFDKIYAVEEHPLQFDKAFFFSLSEELRLYVCIVSKYVVQDIERPLEEFEISDDESFLEELFIRLVRVYRALQFEQYAYAKKEYDGILQVYENLPLEDKNSVFGETSHVFVTLRYAVERARLDAE